MILFNIKKNPPESRRLAFEKEREAKLLLKREQNRLETSRNERISAREREWSLKIADRIRCVFAYSRDPFMYIAISPSVNAHIIHSNIANHPLKHC
jgi:hypothetical protein